MIKSMTGFGRGKYEINGRIYIIEIKSVNHKYSDISVRLPKFFNFMEDKIRKRIGEVISRGKIDVFVNFINYSGSGVNIKINRELAKEYIKELKQLSEETGVKYDLTVTDVSNLPEILKIEEEDNEEIISKELMIALDEALNNFVDMREFEGQKLIEDIEKRIHILQDRINEISKYSSTLVQDYIKKLEIRVNDILKTSVVDETRLAQEIVLYVDKSSIEEEIIRLKSHISQFLNLIKQSSPLGKKFDFIVQEMNREINTIGSKANCLEITNQVIELKTELENIREQIQNVE